tara:strand:+ start:33296 stop:33760 length:465 start_codon:yes stop_codon:yes gene_type:complete
MSLDLWKHENSSSSLSGAFDSILGNYGHHVLYRRYNVGNVSEFYKADTGSSTGGPKWTYVDEVTKTRHDPMSIRGAVGVEIQKSKMYLSTNMRPKRGDVIIELEYEEGSEPSDYDLYVADHSGAFEIVEIDAKRGLKGIIQFYICQVIPHMGDY